VTSLWERLAVLVLLVAGASAARNMVWLALGALPVLAVAVERIVPADPPPTAFGERVNRGLAVVAAGALVALLAVTLARPTSAFERDYPQRYLDAVTRAAAIDPASQIVADVGDADWLLWRAPSLRGRLAFDARLELLSASGVHDIASLLRGHRTTSLMSASRIFALDPRSASAALRHLATTPGRRILFSDSKHVVVLVPTRARR
jgi:hypothetical protein